MERLLSGSKFEALSFNCVSFGIFTIVNNLWTWVAVITAALSFWRIRAAAVATSSSSIAKPDPKPSSTSIIDNARDESPLVLEAEAKPIPSSSTLTSAPAPAVAMETSGSPSVRNDNRVSITKGEKFKLTVYYDGESEGEMIVTERGYGEWWESWERLLRVRKGESQRGWYRYLDLTAINGNVVRLWEDKRHVKQYEININGNEQFKLCYMG